VVEAGEQAQVHAEQRGVVSGRGAGVGAQVGGSAQPVQQRLDGGERRPRPAVEEQRLRAPDRPRPGHRRRVQVRGAVPAGPGGERAGLVGGAGGQGDQHPVGEIGGGRVEDVADGVLVGHGHHDDAGGGDGLRGGRRGHRAPSDERVGPAGRTVPDGDRLPGVAQRPGDGRAEGAQAEHRDPEIEFCHGSSTPRCAGRGNT
jgi:hypothetical protein